MAKNNVSNMTEKLRVSSRDLIREIQDQRKRATDQLSALKELEEAVKNRQRMEQERQEHSEAVVAPQPVAEESAPAAPAPKAMPAADVPAPQEQPAPAPAPAHQQAPSEPVVKEEKPAPAPAPKAAQPQQAPAAPAPEAEPAAPKAEEKPAAPAPEAKPAAPKAEEKPAQRPVLKAEAPKPVQRQYVSREELEAQYLQPVRPARPAQPRPYQQPRGENRTYTPRDGQGSQRPYQNRDGQGGQRPYPPRDGQGGQRPYQNRDGQGGQRPYTPRDGQGGQRPFNKDEGGFSRPMGAGRPTQRTNAERELKKQLEPVATKGRAGAFDPNKKNYNRKNTPEEEARARNLRARKNEEMRGGYDDDEFGSRSRKPKRNAKVQRIERKVIENAVVTGETITVKALAEKIGKPGNEIIKKLMMMGIMASINQEIDYESASTVALEFGVLLEQQLERSAEEKMIDEYEVEDEANLVIRPPIVTVMGHVDHGKTSLLDAIRKTKVTATEAGGITQHIGAYQVEINDRPITFLDTPGHEAFTTMRMRGAQATDIAVLVIAADDGVMPQTVEAINHAKAADVPVIVAINKIDRPTADPQRIKQQLTEYGLVSEEWGGDTIMAEVSAATGQGISDLLEMILLVADVQELRANPDRRGKGIIIEARLDKNRGPIATVLVHNGTMRVGDNIVVGTTSGRVRAMFNDVGQRVTEAGPSVPVEILGLEATPEAGDQIYAVEDERVARQIVEERLLKQRSEGAAASSTPVTLDDLFNRVNAGEMKELNIIIKADVRGSAEAVKSSMEKLSTSEVSIKTIHSGVGAVNENDLMLASTSNAIIIAFNIQPSAAIRAQAERQGVDVRTYRVIYNAIEDMELALKGMLAPEFKEVVLGHAEVRDVFRITGVGAVAGCYVTDGKITRSCSIRVLRDSVVLYEGKLSSLKRFKDDVREVASGYECGMSVEGYNDIKEQDVLQAYVIEEVART